MANSLSPIGTEVFRITVPVYQTGIERCLGSQQLIPTLVLDDDSGPGRRQVVRDLSLSADGHELLIRVQTETAPPATWLVDLKGLADLVALTHSARAQKNQWSNADWAIGTSPTSTDVFRLGCPVYLAGDMPGDVSQELVPVLTLHDSAGPLARGLSLSADRHAVITRILCVSAPSTAYGVDLEWLADSVALVHAARVQYATDTRIPSDN